MYNNNDILNNNSKFYTPDNVQNFSDPEDWKSSDKAHFVQFYEADNFLINYLSEYIITSEAALVIGTDSHIKELYSLLNKVGFNYEKAETEGNLLTINVETALEQIMDGDVLNKEKFFRFMDNTLLSFNFKKKPLRIFGEIVAVLWESGNKNAAIELEKSWNDYQLNNNFSLFCAYPTKSFKNKDDGEPFVNICNHHTHVIPSESYSLKGSNNQKLMEIALLQQKAASLETEIESGKLIESKLKVSETRYRRLFEKSLSGIIIVDPETWEILDINQCALKLMNTSKESVVGRKLFDTNILIDEQEGAKIMKHLSINSMYNVGELVFKNGTDRFADVNFLLYEENDIKLLQCSLYDITDRKQLEKQKDNFISSASHELKTPLTSQKAYINLLMSSLDKGNPDSLRMYLKKVSDQCERIQTLLDDMFNDTKIQTGQFVINIQSVDLNKIIKDAIDTVSSLYDSRAIDISGKIENTVLCDPCKISQVITNLLENAIKYSEKDTKVNVFLSESSREAVVCVKDNGIGINLDEQRFIFNRFYRSKELNENVHPGFGIGLYVCYEIIRLHNGRIWVESEPGKGSEFYFSLPLNL